MPYSSVAEAESRNPGIKTLPENAKRIWVGAFNGAKNSGKDDATAAKIAWAAAKRAGVRKNEEDRWVLMSDISNVTIAVDGDNIAFGVPFTKVDMKNRTIEGFATLDNIDKGGEIVDFSASKEAFSDWIGNIREMHAPKAVGKAISIEERKFEKDGKSYNGIWVKSRISKGAPDTWEKIIDGTLAGYSIGGKILERRPEVMKSDGDRYSRQMVNRITKYHLGELSVVDNPMNALALLAGMQKSEGSLIKSQNGELIASDIIVEDKGLFYCETCDVAKTDDFDVTTTECLTCDGMMTKIGQVSEVPGVSELKKMVDSYFAKADTKVCSNCGQSIPADATTCPNCEYKFPTQKGFGNSVYDSTPQTDLTDVNQENNNLITETRGLVGSDNNAGIPVSKTDTPEEASPSLDTQTTDGDLENDAVTKVADRLFEAIKSRVESSGLETKSRDEEVAFVEAMLSPEDFKAVTNANKTPPKGKPTDRGQYADSANFKYPIDNPSRIRAAMVYFNHPGQREAGGYSMSQWASIGRRIASAANSAFGKGHSYSGGKIESVHKLDYERGKVLLELQKNNTSVNNNVVDLLKNLIKTLSKGNSPTIEGGETPTLDVNEFTQKILDILEVATSELKDVSKAFSVQNLNSESGGGTTVGGSDPGDAGVGTSDATDGGHPLATNDVTVAQATSLATADAPQAAVPDAISTDGTGAFAGITADSSPEKALPHAFPDASGNTAAAVGKAEGAEDATKENENELTKMLSGIAESFDKKFDEMTSRLEGIENSGGGKKSGEVSTDNLEKNDNSVWNGSFYAGEFDRTN